MSGYIDQATVEQIKDNIDIVDLISQYVSLKKSGANYVGLCPFHNEKTPSFTVSDTKNIFHCFGCGEGGDGLSFVMKKENMPYPQALKFLAEKMGIQIIEKKVDDEKAIIRDKTYEINRQAALYYYNNLGKETIPKNYLKNRKINFKTIQRFGLGYSLNQWEALYNYLISKGYKDDEIETTGLIGKKKNNNGYFDKMRNRIIFPIIDIRSRVIGFGGRVIDDTMPKYLNSPDTVVFNKGDHLYGINLVDKHSNRKRILLVEGYMDVIALASKGINYSVASLGTALTPRQAKLLSRYGQEVYICYDGDDAGTKATLKAIDILKGQGVNPRIVLLPKGQDPDDYINKYGQISFEKELVKAIHHVDFKIKINKDKFNLNRTEEKVEFTRQIAKIIKELKSPIERDAYISKIADQTDISKDAIKNEIRGNNYRRNIKPFKENIKPIDTKFISGQIKAEIELINIMINDKDYFEYVNGKLKLDQYSMEESQEIIKIMNHLYNDQQDLDKDVLFSEILEIPNLDRQKLKLIYEYSMDYKSTNVEKIIDELIDTINSSNILNRRKLLLDQIYKLENKNRNQEEDQEFKDLCMELVKINKEINLKD